MTQQSCYNSVLLLECYCLFPVYSRCVLLNFWIVLKLPLELMEVKHQTNMLKGPDNSNALKMDFLFIYFECEENVKLHICLCFLIQLKLYADFHWKIWFFSWRPPQCVISVCLFFLFIWKRHFRDKSEYEKQTYFITEMPQTLYRLQMGRETITTDPTLWAMNLSDSNQLAQ